ncbi:Hypothetical predicted protein [Marmota monax]|uniref:Uncharacterized protein n=1 Tax=Marmota monax TaxID=9995 RepID=A0A5E4BGF9_MARMO|nr:hypothetical protein GHT09_005798 [Marmota monax]VTJ68773.1 Hypothetical predicted protein [Marmota monax]
MTCGLPASIRSWDSPGSARSWLTRNKHSPFQLPTLSHAFTLSRGPVGEVAPGALPLTSVASAAVSVVEAECEKSSATTYFWYREALDISNSISESGGLNWKMTLCLLVAWSIVGMAVVKGIQSSGKVMYFSSLFPYVVLACFLVRGLLLRGAVDGILHMFTPKEGSFRGPVTSGIKKVPESSELPLESHSPQGDQQKLCSPYIEGVDKAQVSSRRTPSFPKDGLSPPVVSPLCGPL